MEKQFDLTADEMEIQSQKIMRKIKFQRRMRNIFILLSYVVLIMLILSLWKCSDNKKEASYAKQLKVKSDSINLLIRKVANLERKVTGLEGREARPVVVNKKTGREISAIIVDANDERPRSLFIANTVVEVPIPCPEIDSSVVNSLQKENEELTNSINTIDSMLNRSVEVCMDKEYSQDSSVVLLQEAMRIKALLSSYPPSISYSNIFTEYLPNPYRIKAKNSFWWGVGTGAGATLLYGISEAIGTPVYIDGEDNLEAQKKSDLILGLRIGSGVCTAVSLFKFGQTIYFHNKEGQFIVGPNKIGLYVNLDNLVK